MMNDEKEAITSWPPSDQDSESLEIERTLRDKQKRETTSNALTPTIAMPNVAMSPASIGINIKNPPKKMSFSNHISSEVCRRKDPPNVYTADIAIARWWKQEGKTLYSREVLIPHNCSVHTQLHLLARSEPGKRFLAQEIKRLTKLKSQYPKSPVLNAALATMQEKCGLYQNAKENLIKAIHCQLPGQQLNEYKWLLERINRQLNIIEKQRQLLLDIDLLNENIMPAPAQVDKREISSLSYEEFLDSYAKQCRPVIIKGLAHQITSTQWNLDHVLQKAGDCKVTLKKLDQSSVEWARLENAEESTVGQFIHDLPGQETCLSMDDKRYLFDWSIPLNCPRLAEELVIPKYFSGDLLLRTSPGSLYRDSWPSLFIAPAGLKSELHVDAFGSNFWMAMFEGSKRWLFFDKEDVPMLYPEYANSMDPVFGVDLAKPDLQCHPLLALTHPKECILEAGDVLFVPAGCPHTVYNLEQSVAISANFVDISNCHLVKNELGINSLVDSRAADLLEQLNAFDIQKIAGNPESLFLNTIKQETTNDCQE